MGAGGGCAPSSEKCRVFGIQVINIYVNLYIHACMDWWKNAWQIDKKKEKTLRYSLVQWLPVVSLKFRVQIYGSMDSGASVCVHLLSCVISSTIVYIQWKGGGRSNPTPPLYASWSYNVLILWLLDLFCFRPISWLHQKEVWLFCRITTRAEREKAQKKMRERRSPLSFQIGRTTRRAIGKMQDGTLYMVKKNRSGIPLFAC